MSRASSVDEVLDLYRRFGAVRYDEDLAQLDHALQTAALAGASGAAEPLVAAALLHDVGHLLAFADGDGPNGDGPNGAGDLRHEVRGAVWLAGLFGPAVTRPIALHVRAKRYRVSVDLAYAAGLSNGSSASLVRQGGPMTAREVVAFENLPGFSDAVALRGWDDHGKVDGLAVAGLDIHRPLLERLAR